MRRWYSEEVWVRVVITRTEGKMGRGRAKLHVLSSQKDRYLMCRYVRQQVQKVFYKYSDISE